LRDSDDSVEFEQLRLMKVIVWVIVQQSFLEEDDQIHSTTSVMLTFCCVSKRAFCCMFRLEFFILLAG
jgi:hypothetical protein